MYMLQIVMQNATPSFRGGTLSWVGVWHNTMAVDVATPLSSVSTAWYK